MAKKLNVPRDAKTPSLFQKNLSYRSDMTKANDKIMPISTSATKISSIMEKKEIRYARQVSMWLFTMAMLVVLMVVVGGATRLTDSGLSITEWKPVVGALPPLSDADWQSEFQKYQQIPEYQEVNFGMSLGEFKTIYWWEWGHRLLGRFLGVAFLIPFIVFVLTRQITGSFIWKGLALLLLGGLQGALGWYMVKSGLSDRVDVSQYRLAAHLGLAVFLFMVLVWFALDLRMKSQKPLAGIILPIGLKIWALLMVVAVYGQILLGAFVAGLRAGRTYNDWPLMDGAFIPSAYFQAKPRFLDLFESIAAVQFNHRMGAYFLFAFGVLFFIKARRTALAKPAKFLLMAMSLQAVLGIATLMLSTPLWLGLSHQVGAMLVLFLALRAGHIAIHTPSK